MATEVKKITPLWPQARVVAAELSEKDWEVLNGYCITEVYDEALQDFRRNYYPDNGDAGVNFGTYRKDEVILRALEREFISTVYQLRNCGLLGRG